MPKQSVFFALVWLTSLLSLLSKVACRNPGDPLVYEMDDSGHCRKLEPILEEIGDYYKDKSLNVAKVDATRFIKAANHFNIKGYPTIKFKYGEVDINFYGERRKEDIIEFIERADAPRVTRVIHRLDFEHNKVAKPLFFLLIAKGDDKDKPLLKDYFDMANKHFLDAYFYYSHPDYVAKSVVVYGTPKVAIVKDNDLYFYSQNEYKTLDNFIQLEQFMTFAEITLTNFQNLLKTKKYLVVLLINSKDTSRERLVRKIKQYFKIYSKTNRNSFYREFQFGYTENRDLLNSIAIWTLPAPILFILNTTSYEYSLVDVIDSKNKMIELDIDKLLNDTRELKLEVFGGNSIFRTIKRPLWEMYRAILEMFIEAPFISMLIFGFPLGVISVVCYFLCCMDDSSDPSDDQINEDGELSDSDLEDEHQEQLEEANKLIADKPDVVLPAIELPVQEAKVKLQTTKKKNQ